MPWVGHWWRNTRAPRRALSLMQQRGEVRTTFQKVGLATGYSYKTEVRAFTAKGEGLPAV